MPRVAKEKKTFTKTKLKVGKHKQIPQNQTDTTFKAKSIVIPGQSVNRVASKSDVILEHTLALLSHKSGDVRKDALLKLTSYLVSHPPSVSTILTPLMRSLVPLVLDDTKAVRKNLLDLFDSVLSKLSSQILSSHSNLLLLYISSAMSHITPSIRADSSKFLSWTFTHTNAVGIIVSTQLSKFMGMFAALLGWTTQNSSIQVGRSLSLHLDVFNQVLIAALLETRVEIGEKLPTDMQSGLFIPHRHSDSLLLPCDSIALFTAEFGAQNLDAKNFMSIEPHIPVLSRYLADRFTDAVNGDRSLCLPVLRIVRTLSTQEGLEQDRSWSRCINSLLKGMTTLESLPSVRIPEGLTDEWSSIIER